LFVWLSQTDRINQINQINQMNQIDKTDQKTRQTGVALAKTLAITAEAFMNIAG
jgi:hypothetical protein